MYEAKTHFSKIINSVEHNEVVLISRNGKPVAKIIPFTQELSNERKFGELRNQIKIKDDFDEELPDDIIDSFYSGHI